MNQDQNPYQNQPYSPNNTYGQMPNQGMGQAPGWNQPPGYGQNYPGRPQSTQGGGGLAIASMVLGIASVALCCAYGGVFGIVGLVLGIVSCVRREERRGMAIAGIITSSFGILILGIMLLFGWLLVESELDYLQDFDADAEIDIEQFFREYEDEGEANAAPDPNIDLFAGREFVASDDSVIYFENDQSFLWYQDDDDHEDNYYQGTYTTYRGEAAIDVLIYDMTEYGVTAQEMDDYFARNADNHIYSEENFAVLTLRTEQAVIDGEEQEMEPYERNYMGFFPEEYGYYDAANMDSGEYAFFIVR